MTQAKIWQSVPVAALVAFLASAPARAATTWYVANNGTDANNCNLSTSPCRSISHAIGLASSGDTIIVGPGVYGDLNQNGTFGDFPGEETAPPACDCMIQVDKALTIVSRSGARETVLDARGLKSWVVDIQGTSSTTGTVFGKVNKGFTLRAGSGLSGSGGGLMIPNTESGIQVAGNIATHNNNGFLISGNSIVVADNIATRNFNSGITLQGTGNSLLRNRATMNGSNTNPSFGFEVQGIGHVVKQNVATENLSAGFVVDVGGVGTCASNCGVFKGTTGFSSNAAIGNGAVGIAVRAATGFEQPGSLTLKGNDMFGNGANAAALPNAQSALGPNAASLPLNCGLVVINDDSTPTNSIDVTASGNFWGANTGPGPDPADNAGGLCTGDAGGGVDVITTSPATKEFVISEKPLG